ncbi:MAG: lipopolysaccharide heptosyltransferase I [Candidatus Methylopumilus sp.]
MPRILLVKTSSMGDVIHNLPVIADIRAHYPSAVFDWVVEESFAEIPRLHHDVSQVIPVAIRRWRKHLLSRKTWQDMAAFRTQLRSQNYDYILDTQGLIKSAMISRLANGKRYGQDAQSAREPLAARLYQHSYFSARNQHAVLRNRELSALALGYPVPTTAPDYGLDADRLATDTQTNTTLPQAYVVGLHATSRDSKLWPVPHWIALGEYLSQHELTLLLPWATEAELDRAKAIAKKVPDCMILPKLGLTKLAAIIARAKAAVGVDTGLAHLAVALKRPTIAIYTDTDPSLTGIYPGKNSIALNIGGKSQSPSPHEVITALSPLI